MKNLIHLFAVIAVMVLLTACTSSKGNENQTPTGAGAPAPTGAAEVYIDVTDAPTEPETFADVTDASTSSNDASLETAPTGAPAGDDYKGELVDHQWKLSKLYKDGEERQIDVEYGSVVRQSGTYIKFNDDDTFECVLGVTGCKGTYTVKDADVKLHITTKYGAKTEECDEYETVRWDHSADTLTFDLNDYTNVFTKGG